MTGKSARVAQKQAADLNLTTKTTYDKGRAKVAVGNFDSSDDLSTGRTQSSPPTFARASASINSYNATMHAVRSSRT